MSEEDSQLLLSPEQLPLFMQFLERRGAVTSELQNLRIVIDVYLMKFRSDKSQLNKLQVAVQTLQTATLNARSALQDLIISLPPEEQPKLNRFSSETEALNQVAITAAESLSIFHFRNDPKVSALKQFRAQLIRLL